MLHWAPHQAFANIYWAPHIAYANLQLNDDQVEAPSTPPVRGGSKPPLEDLEDRYTIIIVDREKFTSIKDIPSFVFRTTRH